MSLAFATLLPFSALTVVLGALPSAASATTRVLTCAHARVERPPRYDLGCGSGTYVLTDLHWVAWTGSSATASGTYVVNTCVPTCAAGHDASYHATISLGSVSATSHGRLFRRARIRYRLRGALTTTSWALPPFS